MALEALKDADRVIGIKQVTKAVKRGAAVSVFVADDADEHVLRPLSELCMEMGVSVVHAGSMQELGKACSIEVGAAAAAVLKKAVC